MKLFKNQRGTSDIVVVSIILGMIGALFITGVFVWQQIEKEESNRDELQYYKNQLIEYKLKEGEDIKDMVSDDNLYYCNIAEDCVPAECCHPTTVVNKNYAPDCAAAPCDFSCQGPLDCGVGKPDCQNNRCIILPVKNN